MIQLAKWQGLKVIASAGSEEKVKFMRECGADIAFNYKTTSTREVLEREGPINMYAPRCFLGHTILIETLYCSYWDNVGGESLEAALEFAAQKAHFVVRIPATSCNSPR